MNWVLVFAGFCFLIVVHEAGHFVAAKACGMRVEKFFLFMGPKIVSVKRGETEYGIAAIPLGGFVKITGMNPEEELPPEVEKRAYYHQPVWKRIVVIGAGPAVNIVLGFLILVVVALTSWQTVTPTVEEVMPKTPAAGALRAGDTLIAVDGHRYPGLSPEDRVERFREEVDSHQCAGAQQDGCLAAQPAKLTVRRNGQLVTISVKPEYSAAAKRALVGFSFGSAPASIGLGTAVDRSANLGWEVISQTSQRIAKIFDPEERKEIHGIVGVSDVGNKTLDLGAAAALTFLAIVSLSLGIVNLFPFLPLDGGHIFWSLVEKLRGRPVSMRVMEGASVVGIALVVALVAIGLSNDISTLTGEGFNVR
jgi:regulator of sigma E protease